MGSTLRSLAVTVAMQMLASMAVLTIPVLAPAAAADVGISAAYVGLYIALVYGASMASSLGCGDLIRKLGAIRVSQICLLLSAIGALLAAGGSLPLFVASALFMGAGYGPVTPASSHVLARTTAPHMMSLVFSLKQTGVPLGGMLAGALVPLMVVAGGWRVALVGVAGACLAVALLAQGLRGELDTDRDPARTLGFGSLSGPLRVVAGAPDVRRLAMLSFFFSAIQLCLVTYLVTYLTTLGHGLVQAGLMLSAAQAAGVFARVGWGALADRSGRPLRVLALLASGMTIAAAATAAFTIHWPLVLVGAVCALFGATGIGWNGVFLAEVARRAPPGRAVEATGGALAMTYFGVLVAPPLFALLVQSGAGFAVAFAVLCVPAFFSAVGLWRWQQGTPALASPPRAAAAARSTPQN